MSRILDEFRFVEPKHRRKYLRAIKKMLCDTCCYAPRAKGMAKCQRCLDYLSVWKYNQYHRRINNKECVKCGESTNGLVRCDKCNLKHLLREKARYRRICEDKFYGLIKKRGRKKKL